MAATVSPPSAIEELRAQVESLQKQLEEAHAGDYNSLARAYRTLLQHVQGLQVEARIIKQHINALDVEVMSPDEVSSQLAGAGVVAALAVAAKQLLKGSRLLYMRRMVYIGGALFLGIRLTTASFSRLRSHLVSNRHRKRCLQSDWENLQERIQIMDDVSRWEGPAPPLLRPPSGSSQSPTRSSGAASSASGWVSLRQGEDEGSVAYPTAGKSTSQPTVSRNPTDQFQVAQDPGDKLGIVEPSLGASSIQQPLKPSGHRKSESSTCNAPSAPPMPSDLGDAAISTSLDE